VREALSRIVQRLETGAREAERRPALAPTEVPSVLRGYTVEAAQASDYDALLVGVGR